MKWMSRILYTVIFLVCIALIAVGQRNIGPAGLLVMLVGLAGILFLLYLYNRRFR
ncbi:MAG: hypothetical protein HFH87_09370 [Lachnospiraceae bacterium]|nr:hypothetical protein [Lachnospiraceae bacterium]